MTSITIPDSVTSIGMEAFSGCAGMTSITIGNGVTTIGILVFAGCSGLSSVTFENTSGWLITTITVGESVKSISSTDLAGTYAAATYLKITYCEYSWERS